MNLVDFTQMSIDSISSRKMRFALNLIGILIGCAAVTGLITLTQGMSNDITGELGTLGVNTINVMAGSGFGPSSMSSQTVSVTLDWRELSIIEGLSDVELAAPIESGGAASYTLKGDTYYVSITGVTDLYFQINEGTVVEEGRELTRNDKGVAVIGYGIANPSTGDDLIEVGDRVKLTSEVKNVEKTITVRVIGIMEEAGGMMSSDSSVYIPLDTYEQFFETNGVYSSIQVLAKDDVNIEYLADTIEEKIDGVMALTAASTMEMINSVIGTIEAVLGGVAAISLLVAGVGIVNTMMVSVMERTKEIGTMKAIGAKSSDILYLFISEAAMTGLMGGVIGALFGFVLGDVVGGIVGVGASPTLALGGLVVGFAIVTSVLSGLYPAWNASKMNPVEALRHQ